MSERCAEERVAKRRGRETERGERDTKEAMEVETGERHTQREGQRQGKRHTEKETKRRGKR